MSSPLVMLNLESTSILPSILSMLLPKLIYLHAFFVWNYPVKFMYIYFTKRKKCNTAEVITKGPFFINQFAVIILAVKSNKALIKECTVCPSYIWIRWHNVAKWAAPELGCVYLQMINMHYGLSIYNHPSYIGILTISTRSIWCSFKQR